MPEEIAWADWIAGLESAGLEGGREAMTAREIARETGRGLDRLRAKLSEAVAAGLLECVIVQRRDVMGKIQHVPGYRIRGSKP